VKRIRTRLRDWGTDSLSILFVGLIVFLSSTPYFFFVTLLSPPSDTLDMRARVCICVRVYVCACMCVHMCVCMCTCACVCTYMHALYYTHICTHINTFFLLHTHHIPIYTIHTHRKKQQKKKRASRRGRKR